MGLVHKIFDAPERGWLGPKEPRKPTPGLHLPAGAHIPDYKIYQVNDYPELLSVQRRLAARGLSSPWLRNEAWRYNRKVWGSEAWRRWDFLSFGWRYALPMLVVTAVYEFCLKKPDHHGHGSGDHGHGHDAGHH